MNEANFLKKQYNLHNSEEANNAAKRTFVRTGEKVSQKPEEKIQNYLDRFQEILDREDSEDKNKGILALKKVLHKGNVIKKEDIPQRVFELEQEIAEEQGHGRRRITQAFIERKSNTIINDQISTLDNWIDYLSSDDAQYSNEMKYWVFRSVLGMGLYNKGESKFEKRTKDTVAPFPTVNARAIAMTIDLVVKKNNKVELGDEVMNNATLLEAVKSEKFSKIYATILKNLPEFSESGLENIRGTWIKYNQGSDHMPLVRSLHGHPLEWCTAAEETAMQQLKGGDFYVYYSEDENGQAKIPRLAVRMDGKVSIAEIRGIEKDQNIDQFIQPVLEEKIKEFGTAGEEYMKASNDMKLLTTITKKSRNGEELTEEERLFVYEIDEPIKGFGYEKDPRIRKVKIEQFIHGQENGSCKIKLSRSLIEYVRKNIDKYSNIGTRAAFGLIKAGYEHDVAKNINQFKYSPKLIHRLVIEDSDMDEEWNLSKEILERINLNEHEEALWIILKEFSSSSRDFDEYLGANFLEIVGKRFPELLDDTFADKLIFEQNLAPLMILNFELFHNLNKEDVFRKIMSTENGWTHISDMGKSLFGDMINSPELVEKLIGYLGLQTFAELWMGDFDRLDLSLAKQLVVNECINEFVDNIDKFEVLDQEIAVALIDEGYSSILIDNIDKFKDVDTSLIALEMILVEDEMVLIDNLDLFSNLNLEVAKKLIERGYVGVVEEDIDRFSLTEEEKNEWIRAID